MTIETVCDGLILLAFVALLGVVFVRDVTTYTIPNTVVVAVIALFGFAYLMHFGDTLIVSHVLSGLAVLIPGWVFFHFRMFGGGDVKVWAALALWYDLDNLPAMVLAIAIIGGVLGIALLVIRTWLPSNPAPSRANRSRILKARIFKRGAPVPYGIAIALGTLLTVNRIPLFASLPLP